MSVAGLLQMVGSVFAVIHLQVRTTYGVHAIGAEGATRERKDDKEY